MIQASQDADVTAALKSYLSKNKSFNSKDIEQFLRSQGFEDVFLVTHESSNPKDMEQFLHSQGHGTSVRDEFIKENKLNRHRHQLSSTNVYADNKNKYENASYRNNHKINRKSTINHLSSFLPYLGGALIGLGVTLNHPMSEKILIAGGIIFLLGLFI